MIPRGISLRRIALTHLNSPLAPGRRANWRRGRWLFVRACVRFSGSTISLPISLGIGVPAGDTVPKEELALSMQRAVLQGDDSIGRGHSVWGYGWANPIREALAAHFSRVRLAQQPRDRQTLLGRVRLDDDLLDR